MPCTPRPSHGQRVNERAKRPRTTRMRARTGSTHCRGGAIAKPIQKTTSAAMPSASERADSVYCAIESPTPTSHRPEKAAPRYQLTAPRDQSTLRESASIAVAIDGGTIGQPGPPKRPSPGIACTPLMLASAPSPGSDALGVSAEQHDRADREDHQPRDRVEQ